MFVGSYALSFIAKLAELIKQSDKVSWNLPNALYNSIKNCELFPYNVDVLSTPLGIPPCPLIFSDG